ncbi:MAG: transposase zinc-binding domain-containing protein [Methylococcales bacterium]
MKFNAILRQFEAALKNRYVNRLLPGIVQAIHALLRCRSVAAGAIKLYCADCDEAFFQPRSCGHRSCSQCQNHETSQCLESIRKTVAR